ncbi:hypothetical protein QQG55_18485 [Brugia pahangi]
MRTYEYVEIYPGPNLNVIVGLNRTVYVWHLVVLRDYLLLENKHRAQLSYHLSKTARTIRIEAFLRTLKE